MQDSIKNGFTAEKCNFQGVPGYMLKQWLDNSCICSQYIPAEHLHAFCNAAGIDKNKIIFNG